MLCRIIISWSMSKRLDSFIISDLLPNVSSFIYPDSSSLYCRLIRILHICILSSRRYPSQEACLRHNMHISWLVSVIKMKYYFFLWSSWLLTHICIFLSLFLLLFRWWRGISGMLFPTIPFRLYIIIVTSEDLSHFAHIHPKFTHPLYIKGNSFIHSIRAWQSEIWHISIMTKRITTVSY